jgi:RNA polymerase sigma factor (sigma-70 family)
MVPPHQFWARRPCDETAPESDTSAYDAHSANEHQVRVRVRATWKARQLSMTRRRLKRALRSASDTRPLLVRARERPELFGDFFAAHHEQVLRYFARRTLDPETAFDLMAETFALAFAGLSGFRGETEQSALAWMWTIARNQLHRWRERGDVERRSLDRLGIELPSMSTVEYDRVEELADLSRVRAQVLTSLARLRPAHAEAVRLRVIDERDYPDIAAELGISETLVRAHVSRGLRHLATILEVSPLATEEAAP